MGKKRASISLRKPPSPEAVESFVQGAAEAQPAPEPIVETAAPAVAEAPLLREESSASVHTAMEVAPSVPAMPPAPVVEAVIVGVDGREMRPVTIYLPVAMLEQLSVYCLQVDRDANRVVSEALEGHLSRRLGPAPAASQGDTASEQASSGSHRARASAAGFRQKGAAVFTGRLNRWLELGRAFVAELRGVRWAA